MAGIGSQSNNSLLKLEDILRHPAVQDILADDQLSQLAAASRHGMAQGTLSTWLARVREVAPEKLPERLREARARRSNTSAGNVSAFSKGGYKYPIYARAKAGSADAHPQFDAEPLGHFHSGIRIPARDGVAPFALRIRGDSMTNPTLPYHFPEGTDVLIDPHIEPQSADFVAVAFAENGGRVMVKRLVRNDRTDSGLPGAHPVDTLVSLNPIYAPIRLDNDQHRVIGVVVDSRLPSYTRAQARAM